MTGKRTRSQRKADRRANVRRAERVLPSALAEHKKRPWPLMGLLVLGPEGDGIDADDFEAALQIVEAFKAFTHQLGFPNHLVEDRIFAGAFRDDLRMSERDARLAVLWFTWSTHLPKGLPSRLVRWIEDDEPIVSVKVLRRACRLWLKAKRDQAGEAQDVDKTPGDVLTLPVSLAKRQSFVHEPTAARAVFLPLQPFPAPAAPPPQPFRPSPSAAQTCAATAPFQASHNAVTPAAPPTARIRR
jgi:hypothetical protein